MKSALFTLGLLIGLRAQASFPFQLMISSAEAKQACPETGPQHKYLAVPVDFQNPSAGTYKLHYKLQNPFLPQRPTLIMLHGGPGEGLQAFDKACGAEYCFHELGEALNIVTVDERGAGCSVLPAESAAATTILATAEDIEALRRHLAGNASIYVYGVSFGTVVGTLYAARHPDKVKKLVVEGVVPDSRNLERGVHMQNLNAFLAAKPEVKSAYESVQKKVAQGLLPGIATSDLTQFLGVVLYGYEGLWKTFPRVILALDRGDLTEWNEKYPLMTGQMADMYDSQALRYIDCRELMAPETLKRVGLWDRFRCGEVPPLAPGSPLWDVKNYAPAITAPTLILNGRWDSTTPPASGDIFKSQIRNSKTMTMPYSGHGGSLKEQHQCGLSLIRSFFRLGLTADLDGVLASPMCQVAE
jgi:pimeloyl-ACP methyl ester carboxylesterase